MKEKLSPRRHEGHEEIKLLKPDGAFAPFVTFQLTMENTLY